MEQSKKNLNQSSIIFALIFGVTYLPVAWLLKHHIY